MNYFKNAKEFIKITWTNTRSSNCSSRLSRYIRYEFRGTATA